MEKVSMFSILQDLSDCRSPATICKTTLTLGTIECGGRKKTKALFLCTLWFCSLCGRTTESPVKGKSLGQIKPLLHTHTHTCTYTHIHTDLISSTLFVHSIIDHRRIIIMKDSMSCAYKFGTDCHKGTQLGHYHTT